MNSISDNNRDKRRQFSNYVPIADYKSLTQILKEARTDKRFEDLNENAEQCEIEIDHFHRDLKKKKLSGIFDEQLANYNAIETGQIEGVYDLNRGITETLIEKGFVTGMISHADAKGQDAEGIILQLRDQKNVLDSLFSFIKNERPITLDYVRNLHQNLCEHQERTTAIDSLGNRGSIELSKGKWKEMPNNPKIQSEQEDGAKKELVFQYCPPNQVQNEMQNLIDELRNVLSNQQPTDKRYIGLIIAAHLHHRFVLIHPFQDGNGRMARILASLVLIKYRFYPFLVNRENRDIYLNSLEAADREILPQSDNNNDGLLRLCQFLLEMQNECLNFGQKLLRKYHREQERKILQQELAADKFLEANWKYHTELKKVIEGEFRTNLKKFLLKEMSEFNVKGEPSFKFSKIELSDVLRVNTSEAVLGTYTLRWQPCETTPRGPYYVFSIHFKNEDMTDDFFNQQRLGLKQNWTLTDFNAKEDHIEALAEDLAFFIVKDLIKAS